MPANRPGRATAALLGLVVAGGVTAAVVDARSATAEAHRAELAAASTELGRDVSQLRHRVAAPAHDAQQATAALQVLVAEAVTGSHRDAAAVSADIERLGDQLRRQADRLEDAAAQPLPPRPEALPVTSVDPLFARLAPLDEQVQDVAAHLRETATQVGELAAAAERLHAAAADYAAATDSLPDGDDPDVHATAWRNELARLEDYRAAVDTAAGFEGLAQLAGAHAGLVEALEGLATDALAELEAGDIEGYNARVEAGVGDDAITTWQSELQAAVAPALDAPAVRHLERSRALTLGLVKELDNLRRSSNGALAIG